MYCDKKDKRIEINKINPVRVQLTLNEINLIEMK
jgi:hypothetical protein